MYAQFRDGAGNTSAASSATIVLDTVAPAGSVAIDGGAASAADPSAVLALAKQAVPVDAAAWNGRGTDVTIL